jgi:WS/DGAT/MGAT family acyltransferase
MAITAAHSDQPRRTEGADAKAAPSAGRGSPALSDLTGLREFVTTLDAEVGSGTIDPRRGRAEGAETTLGWGGGEEMNPSETVMWRAEADRTLRCTGLLIEELDTAPDHDRFLAAHRWAVRMVSRLRQRVVEPPLGLGWPRWSTDPHFELEFHVQRTRLPDGGGWPELLGLAAQLAMAPFDRDRPLWQTLLVEGLPNGRAGYLIKVHHSITDGLGGIQLLSRLHCRSREPRPDTARPEPSADAPISPLDALVRQVRGDVGALPGLVRAAGSGALRAVNDPLRAARAATRYSSSLRRVLTPPETSGSPLLSQRSLTWRFAAIDVPFPGLRAAAKAAGGSVNDAYLAALLGGYRRYHTALGTAVETIPMTIPISLRPAADAHGGNAITAARFAGPVATEDPRLRIRQVRNLIRDARGEPALDVVGVLAPLVARLPAPLVAPAVGPLTKSNDLQASNVPGIGHRVYLAGAAVERMYAFGPLPGCAAMITLLSHGQTACIAVNFDAASITESSLFLNSLLDGFTEVLALQPDTHGQPPLLRY